MHRAHRFSKPLALAIFVSLTAVAPLAASVDLGGRAGAYTDDARAFFGAELLTPLDEARSWYVNPNFEYAFEDRSDLVTLNCDFHYDLDTSGRLAVWFGGGPAVLLLDREFADDDTDVGLNLLAGFGAKRGDFRPYFQGKVIVADDPQAVLGVGVRF